MTPEGIVNKEVEAALSHFRICVLPAPKDLGRLPFSPWAMPDLAHHVGIAWRQNTGALRVGRRFVRFGIPGSSDWTGWLFGKGQRLQLEAKSAAGKLSAHQEANRVLCLNTGVLWGLVRSYDECCQVLESWGLSKAA